MSFHVYLLLTYFLMYRDVWGREHLLLLSRVLNILIRMVLKNNNKNIVSSVGG